MPAVIRITGRSMILLTEYFEEAGAVRDGLVDDELLAAVPDPHVFCHAVDGAYVRVWPQEYVLYLCLFLVDILNRRFRGL